ncbi:type II secretion system F family protein [Weissella koreensis]|uniref:Type II secretory pathway protein n=1 Tax=Weissella koreensis TaxID=165096 RepID=A0A7H1MK98_9LACO|nr:type II secretion system F family protein [Weissella koreensis]AEJ23025.1 Type II secretory pathway/competence component [Weissella koreensis KACC 15510]AVH74626.1 type II secretory pathway protein [Weissella koreensis]EJF33978.1 hypothetical protein JC2156_02860 [Weissella koreensis KCTC 3621]EJF34268.1 hypothetical protein JC2156_01500 [Weissella koreensis KCTC 3621]MCZ9310471.1 type II secretion system F family protein [Weissella koreensis]
MGFKRSQWSRHDQVQFFEVLGDLLNSGYSLQDALNSIQMLQPKNRNILESVLLDMRQGTSFELAIKSYMPIRINFQLSFIQLHGNMRVVVQEIGKQEYIHFIHQQKIKMLLLYPGILLLLVTLLGIGLVLFFSNDIWSNNSNTLLNSPELLGMGLVLILIIIIIILMKNVFRKTILNYWYLYSKIPLLNKILNLLISYYFLFHMGILLKSGVSLATVITRINRVRTVPFIEMLGSEMQKHLLQGEDLVTALKEMPFLPIEAECLFKTGKSQATIGCDFIRLALLKKEQLDRLMERVLLLIQPICFGIIGCLIIALYLKFLLPIYSNMGDFNGW